MINAVKNYMFPLNADWIWSGDSDDMLALHDHEGRIIRISNSVQSVLGLGPKELKGRPITDVLAPQDRSKFLSVLSQICKTGRKERVECRLLKADGQAAWMEITLSTDRKGRIRSIARDIDERHLLHENVSAAKEKAEAEVEIRTNYLADLSHEIRTPLSALIGFADMMKSETFGPLGHEKYEEYAGLIHKGGQHLLSLVSGLLDMAKIEAGKFSLHKEPTDLAELVGDCVELFRLEAENAGLWLKFDVSDELQNVLVDPKAIRQILLNLLSNAIKFTKEGGVIVRMRSDEENIWISVIDTGVGMSQKELSRIGARFEQAHTEGVRGAKGTGLGLALSHALAEMHEGEMRIASREGQGTKAVIRLPNVLEGEKDTSDEEVITAIGQEDEEQQVSAGNDVFDQLRTELSETIPSARKAS